MVDRRLLTFEFIFMIVQIFQNCPQLEYLKVEFIRVLCVEELTNVFKPTTNILDVKLTWTGGAPTK